MFDIMSTMIFLINLKGIFKGVVGDNLNLNLISFFGNFQVIQTIRGESKFYEVEVFIPLTI